MDRKDDNMDLESLKTLLSDVPDTDEFDLDSIIAEVSGTAPAPKAAPAPAHVPVQTEVKDEPTPEPAPAPKPASTPKAEETPKAAPKPKKHKFGKAKQAEKAAETAAAAATDAAASAANTAADTAAATVEETREARIAAREQRMLERQRKAVEKMAERQARRQAQQAEKEEKERREEQEEIAQEAVAQDATRRANISRKQARAARIAADQAEEEAEIRLRDPAEAMKTARRRAAGLTFRALLVLVLAVAAAYLSIAPNFSQLPLPVVLDIIENPTIGIGALMGLLILSLLVGVDVFGRGFSSLMHGRPERLTLVSFSALAAILHGASLLIFPNQGGVTVPYTAVSILMLYAAMREERGRCLAQARSYKAVCEAEQPLAVYSHYDSQDDVCRAVKCPLYDPQAFLTEVERPDTVDRFSLIYTPIALALAIILSLVLSFGMGQPVRFFWAFSAMLSVSAPIGLLCAFGASYKNTAGRLLRSGAAIAGARQAHLLRGTEEVALLENDLFPTGSIELEALDNMGRMSDEKILACAACVTEAAGLELGRVLTEASRARYGVTFTARDVQTVEGGLTGAVGNNRVIVGTAALMVKMGIPVEAGKSGQCIYLVVDNALAGILTMRYQTTKNTYRAMRLMRRMHMNAVLAIRDFNISPAMVEEEFDLRRGFADQPDAAGVARMLDPNYARGDSPAAILTREGAGPFMQVLRGADKLAGAVRSALTLGTFAGLLGMLIVFYLLHQNVVDALPVMNLLLYQLIWYVPVFIITQQTH